MERLTNERLQVLYGGEVASGRATRGDHPSPEVLHRLAARSGDEAERLATMDHVMSCAACRKAWELLAAVEAAREPGRRMAWRPLAIAATLLLAAGLTLSRLVTAPTGGVTRGGAPPVVIEPADDVAATDARRVTWHSVPDAIRYDAELLSADGQPVHSAATGDTSYVLPFQIVLAPGATYQWLVSAELSSGQRVVAPARRFRVFPQAR